MDDLLSGNSHWPIQFSTCSKKSSMLPEQLCSNGLARLTFQIIDVNVMFPQDFKGFLE